MNRLKIWWYKKKAKRVVLAINALYDHFSCGADLIDQVTGGRLTRLKYELEEYKVILRKIDPNFPS